MRRVLITGARGFLGSNCLRALLSRGDVDLHAVTSSTWTDGDGIAWHRVDLLAPSEVGRLIREVRPTHLLHLAWCTTPGEYWSDPVNLRWVEGSLALVRAFQGNGGQRAVVTGTCAEYDWSYGFCSEHRTPLVPATLYGASKHALQTVCSAFAAETGVSLAWGRLFFLYGPGEHPSRFVASAVRAMLRGEVARCTHGRQLRDYLMVEDAADAVVTLLFSDTVGPVNIGSGNPVTLGSVVERIADQLDRRDLVGLGRLRAPEGELPLLVADTRRLFQEVGWTPRLPLDEGLARTIAWWKRQSSATPSGER